MTVGGGTDGEETTWRMVRRKEEEDEKDGTPVMLSQTVESQ